jgi:hypothetical protein
MKLREDMLGSALNLDEVAYILGLDRTTVAKYLRESTIAGFQIGREWLVPEVELRNYVRGIAEGRRGQSRVSDQAQTWTAPAHRGIIERMRADLPLVGKRKDAHEQVERSRQQRFDKFTDRARAVLSLAQEEAQRLNHNYIGTEHLLLGMIREGEGVAAKVLANMGVELDRVRTGVEFIIGRGDRQVSGEVGLTPRAKKVIELAVDEARQLGHHYIGTEHLLLGLIREGDGIAAGVLESLSVRLDNARDETMRVLSERVGGRTAREKPVPHPAPAEAATLVSPDQERLICPVCGAQSPAYFRFCFNCGEALGSDSTSQDN